MTLLKQAVRTTAYVAVLGCVPVVSSSALAQEAGVTAASPGRTSEVEQLRAELAEARDRISTQERTLDEQRRRLDLLEQRLSGLAQTTQQIRSEALAAAPSGGPASGVEVGEAPADADRAPTVAVLDQQGSVLTRQGQLIGELGVDYTRSDRNRAIFRGLELIESILVGTFDINESRQDIVTGTGSLRYGLFDRFEIGARLPYVYRSEKLVRTPVAGSTTDDEAATIDSSVNGSGIGDLELTARYQLNNGGRRTPFIIANLQATIPTGRDPFEVRRDANGSPLQASTGAGFLGITPSLTAILPSEPAVLFANIGYTKNFAEDVDVRFPPEQIDRVEPGDQISGTLGIGLALNELTSLNFGYSHAWTFGTETITRRLDQQTGEPVGAPRTRKTRDLQIGRLLFGFSHRFADNFQVNSSFEIGATEDAPDVRASLRFPFVIFR